MLRKKHRLPTDRYFGNNIYFITIVTHKKTSVFTSGDQVVNHLDVMRQSANKFGFVVLVYCFMPDHLHLLLSANDSTSDLIAFVKHYKQITGHQYSQQMKNPLWQKSYYDHILRKDEDINAVIRYVLENPVRKKLVDCAAGYPYSGSLAYGTDVYYDT